jgi:hypothetical protein
VVRHTYLNKLTNNFIGFFATIIVGFYVHALQLKWGSEIITGNQSFEVTYWMNPVDLERENTAIF